MAKKIHSSEAQEVIIEEPNWDLIEELAFNSQCWEQNPSRLKLHEKDLEFWSGEGAWALMKKGSGQLFLAGLKHGGKNQNLAELLAVVNKKYPEIKWNNIDATEEKLLGYLGSIGFRETFRQFEMVKPL